MKYSILKFGIVFPLFLSGAHLEAEERVFGYRGAISALSSTSIQSMAIRPDGRYLFYTSGDAKIYALDLLDMARTGLVATADEQVVKLSMLSQDLLGVATKNGSLFYTVSKPFDPTLSGTKFVRSDSSRTVTDACFLDGGIVVFFEEGGTDNDKTLLRYALSENETATLSWNEIFSRLGESAERTLFDPVGLRCQGTNIYLLARKPTDNDTDKFYVIHINQNKFVNVHVDPQNYDIKDYFFSADSNDFLVMLNRSTKATASDDTMINRVSLSSFTNSTLVPIGSEGQGLFTYQQNGANYFGFMMANDLLEGATYTFMRLLSDGFSSLGTSTGSNSENDRLFGDRGLGASGLGSRPTLIASSSSDHYFYVRTASSGIAKFSKAPSLEFVGTPSAVLTASNALEFALKSVDSNLNYEVWFDESQDADGSTTGLQKSGRLVKSGVLLKGESSATLTLSSSDLGIEKNQDHSVFIFAESPDDPAPRLVSRLGFRFAYDPPPSALKNFKLGWGDQSVRVSGSLPNDGDIESVVIYFSYDATDLAGSTPSPASIAKLSGGTLDSPITVDADGWSAYVLAPIGNGQKLYVRVQLVDASGQSSFTEVKSITPYRTMSVQEALGGSQTCSLNAAQKFEMPVLWVFILFGLGLAGLRRGIKKLGPALLRNRRGGD